MQFLIQSFIQSYTGSCVAPASIITRITYPIPSFTRPLYWHHKKL
jgi:hypothetical protein